MSLSSPQSHQQMSTRQRRMLMDMGIDVWTSRSSSPIVAEVEAGAAAPPVPAAASGAHTLAEIKASLAEVSGDGMVRVQANDVALTQDTSVVTPPVTEPEVLQADRIHLYFAKKANVLYICEEPISGPSQSFVQDLLLCLNWSVSNGEFEASKKSLLSEFQWPVVATSGTPERAVAAFLDKHGLTSPNGIGLLSAGAMRVLKPWLPSETSCFIEVPDLAELATDALAKEKLWGQLGHL
mgnify:CR=1 FL=1